VKLFGLSTLFRDHPNPMKKKGKILVHLEIFWFEHSGRFIVLPPTQKNKKTVFFFSFSALLSYGYDLVTNSQFTVL